MLLAIIKQPNANLVDVSDNMAKQVASLKKILPKDVNIVPYYIQADFVNDAIKVLQIVYGSGWRLPLLLPYFSYVH